MRTFGIRATTIALIVLIILVLKMPGASLIKAITLGILGALALVFTVWTATTVKE